MYYSIFDLDTLNYLYSGRNSISKEEAIQAGIEYLTNDWDDKEVENIPKEEYEELLYGYNFQIHEHEEKIGE